MSFLRKTVDAIVNLSEYLQIYRETSILSHRTWMDLSKCQDSDDHKIPIDERYGFGSK